MRGRSRPRASARPLPVRRPSQRVRRKPTELPSARPSPPRRSRPSRPRRTIRRHVSTNASCSRASHGRRKSGSAWTRRSRILPSAPKACPSRRRSGFRSSSTRVAMSIAGRSSRDTVGRATSRRPTLTRRGPAATRSMRIPTSSAVISTSEPAVRPARSRIPAGTARQPSAASSFRLNSFIAATSP